MPVAGAIIGGLLGAGGSIIAGGKASDATSKASKQAIQLQRDALRQQAGLTKPYRDFGEAGIGKLSRLLGLGTPNKQAALVPLPGLSLKGQHTPKKSEGVTGLLKTIGHGKSGFENSVNPISQITTGLDAFGKNNGKPAGALFYDPSSNSIVDANGTTVAAVPKSGVIPGVMSGFNNQVSVGPDGKLTSVGQHGSSDLNLQLTPQEAATGANSADDNAGILAELRNMPGYQFTQKEGNDATKGSFGAMGLGLSGNTLKALDTFNTGLADSTYQSEVNNLQNVVGIGEAAATGQAANIGNAAGQIGNIAIGQGNTLAGIDANVIAGITRAGSNAYNNYTTQRTLAGLMGNDVSGGSAAGSDAFFNSDLLQQSLTRPGG